MQCISKVAGGLGQTLDRPSGLINARTDAIEIQDQLVRVPE